MSDDEDEVPKGPSRSRSNKLPIASDSSPSSSSSGSPILSTAPRNSRLRRYQVIESETDSDSDYSIIITNKRKRAVRIESDESDSSPIVTRRTKGCVFNIIDSESDESASDKDSDASTGESDCPICLLSFKKQELGTPESCDHTFCLACIEEWSKNMNTCPVDRQEYALILVRKKIDGKIVRKIPVEKPAPIEERLFAAEDQICCEICGSGDREDRLLLCDGCDLGFHLECLTPPLETIPIDNWFCAVCTERRESQSRGGAEHYSTVLWMEGLLGSDVTVSDSRPRRTSQNNSVHFRLIPRTRQNERVRTRIMNNRQTENEHQEPTSTTDAPRRRRRRVYEVNTQTGRVRVKRSKRAKRKKKKNSGRVQRTAARKTTKKRIALQLGICAARSGALRAPDAPPNGGLNLQRHLAGIPVLHLFGQRNELDYYEDEVDVDVGDHVVARRPNRSDVSAFRRAARRKSVLAVSSSTDVLGSILEHQSAFFSKGTEFSVDKTGAFKMAPPRDVAGLARETPQYGRGNRGNRNYNQNYYNRGGYYNNYRNQQRPYNNPYWGPRCPENAPVNNDDDQPQDYSRSTLSSLYDNVEEPREEKDDEDVDIYSDIEENNERVEEIIQPDEQPSTQNTEYSDGEDSDDPDMVIDTQKEPQESQEIPKDDEQAISSSKDDEPAKRKSPTPEPSISTSEEPAVTTSKDDDDDSDDGCPNLVRYSMESIAIAKSTEIPLGGEDLKNQPLEQSMTDLYNQCVAIADGVVGDEPTSSNRIEDTYDPFEEPISEDEKELDDIPVPPSPKEDIPIPPSPKEDIPIPPSPKADKKVDKFKPFTITSNVLIEPKQQAALYSDSEDEEVVKKNETFDLSAMTEDIVSEEERSYTPCLDERRREGLEGLDTEAISEDDKNDFDESYETKATSEADALEINAKESEMNSIRLEDYEEGEIVDKALKEAAAREKEKTEFAEKVVKEDSNKENKESFKKISKSNKERNYRKDKEKREKSKSPERETDKEKRENKRSKRKELERYNVRAMLAEKPRRFKDQFGRDLRRSSSNSRSPSAARTPPPQTLPSSVRRLSPARRRSPRRRSPSRKKRRKSSSPRRRKRSPSRRKKTAKRKRSASSASPYPARRVSPSWTPPPQHLLESAVVNPHRNLTVILPNDSANKAKKKNRKRDKKGEKRKRRRDDRTPPPSKEVFASGDNILVSVSFNKENERDVSTRKKKDADDALKKKREKERKALRRKKRNQELQGVKPVAIIDLDRSPFKELTPSPRDVIVLTDSDTEAAAPETRDASPGGPKTPPEPLGAQVKFSLMPKAAPVRAMANPLRDDDDEQAEEPDEQHVGPNTPPDPEPASPAPPSARDSPPSSPDAYDPFEPTKSRSPTPEPISTTQSGDGAAAESVSTTTDPAPAAADVQPADSQTGLPLSPEIVRDKTPEPAVAVAVQPATTPPPRVNILSATVIGAVAAAAPKASPMKKTGKVSEVIELDSPYSPGSNDYDDLFDPPPQAEAKAKAAAPKPTTSTPSKPVQNIFDTLFGSPFKGVKKAAVSRPKKISPPKKGTKSVGIKIDEEHLKILDDLPNSAVELQVKDKFLKKLNRQERVVEEVKLVLKPYYNKKKITKDEYKDIMRKAVPKICHNKSGEINPFKIQKLVEAYVRKIKHSKKVSSSSK